MRQDRRQPALLEFAFESGLVALDPQALVRLARQVWRANTDARVTGEMRLAGRHVSQVVEGEAPAVLALVARVLADPRHEGIDVTALGPLRQRRFCGWGVHGLVLPERQVAADGTAGGRPIARAPLAPVPAAVRRSA